MEKFGNLEILCNALVSRCEKSCSVLDFERFANVRVVKTVSRKIWFESSRPERLLHMRSYMIIFVSIAKLRRALSKASHEDGCTTRRPRDPLWKAPREHDTGAVCLQAQTQRLSSIIWAASDHRWTSTLHWSVRCQHWLWLWVCHEHSCNCETG